VIDPPPILSLTLDDYDSDSPADVNLLKNRLHVVNCTLWSMAHGPNSTPVEFTVQRDQINGDRDVRRLMGSVVANQFVGTDPDIGTSASENARLGVFFIFNDLSCRQTGEYKLRFTLTSIDPNFMASGAQAPIVAEEWSEVFSVYNAKDFPGMSKSSPLVMDLKKQGAPISVKKGHDPNVAAAKAALLHRRRLASAGEGENSPRQTRTR